MRSRAVTAVAVSSVALSLSVDAAASEPRVAIVDDGVRVKKDASLPVEAAPSIALHALRGETVAFQVVVAAGDATLAKTAVELEAFIGPKGNASLAVERFIEHFTKLERRSFNARRPLESLGWSPKARPSDDADGGTFADALIPVDLAPSWEPYPMAITPKTNGVVWIDVAVPKDAAPGVYRSRVRVVDGDTKLAELPLSLEIGAPALPYRPVSFLAYYGRGELDRRLGAKDADAGERQLVQLLHAHHVDALMSLEKVDDVTRLAPALDGSLFTRANGYRGAGEGVAPAAVALGAYGNLGEPDAKSIAAVRAMVAKIPSSIADVFLYAADEDCDSDLGPRWRAAIKPFPELARVEVAHSCNRDPRSQDVDLILTPSNDLMMNESVEARARGKKVWAYNGQLPRSGPLLVDAPLTSLRADGFIAASHDVGRWFLWETTFWNDENKGGHGPIDPFATFESFHNQHGDTANGDGLLLYPGEQLGDVTAHSAGFAGVFPSMRLKNLRRGIEDAGYVALARAEAPGAADAIVARLIPASLDEVKETAASSIPDAPEAFARAREELRALIKSDAALSDDEAVKVLAEGAAARRRDEASRATRHKLALGGGALSVVAVVAVAVAMKRRRDKTRGG